MKFELSKHTRNMMAERKISEEWIRRAINNPERTEENTDNNIHCFKSIPEQEGRILHVVINTHIVPEKVVTVFFDRRARRKNEAKNRQR